MFAESFEKTAELRTFPKEFIGIGDRHETHPEGNVREDLLLKNLRLGYQAKHSPLIELLAKGSQLAVPVASIAAIASPAGRRLRNAIALGGLAGLGYGLPAAARQWYGNKLEDAHIQFHMDRLNYAPRK